jgi:hypothetical protein
MDVPVDYFCEVAHARAKALISGESSQGFVTSSKSLATLQSE